METLLAGLSLEDRGRLAVLFSRRAYPAGAEIIRQGEPCDSLFVIESGTAVVHSSQGGDLAHRGPDDCLGEASLFTGEPACATITAVTDVVLRTAAQAEIRALMEELPVLASNFCRLLSRRLAKSAQGSPPRRTALSLLVSAADAGGIGLALNLASSLSYHLQRDVALVDLSGSGAGQQAPAEPLFHRPVERLNVVRAAGLRPGQILPLIDSLARDHAHVVAWASQPSEERLAPLVASVGVSIVALPYEALRPGGCQWEGRLSQIAAHLLILGGPEPRSVAMSETIARETGLPVIALLPDLPAALKPASAAPDWVIQHPNTSFAQAAARLARRLIGKRVGAALGFGGGRGHALVASLRALERLGVRPDLLAGTSVGACVAAAYAYGLPFHEIELSIQSVGQFLRQRILSIYSLMAGAGLDRAMQSVVGPDLKIEDLPLPCGFIATDLMSGEEVVLRRGLVWQCARASSTIPGLFPPAELEGRLLVDGAVVCPVPCQAVRAMGADIVLGISLETAPKSPQSGREQRLIDSQGRWPDTLPKPKNQRTPTWPAIVLRTFDLQQQALTRQCLQAADVPIRVFTPPISLTDFRGGPEFVEAGERAVEAAGDQLRALMPWVRG